MTTSKPSVTYVDYLGDEEPSPAPNVPKKKRLTKEERKERQLKAQQEFKKLEIYDQFKRELTLCKKSSLRGRQKWMDMCRQIKLVQMKEELQSWEAKTNRILTQKDEKISRILEEIKETEEMHKRNFSTQLQIMDYLKDTFRVFQEVARLRYEAQVSDMLHHFFDESHERKQIEDGYQRNCESVLHATNLIVEETLHEDLEIFLDKRDDLVNSEIVKRYGLRDSVATKMQKLHKQLLEFLDSLRNISLDAHKYERVNTLTERQRIFVIESQKLDDTEAFYARQHDELQNELVRVEAEDQRKINDLKLEMGYFLDLRKNIELQMKADGELTHEKLKVLTTQCYGLCKNLQKLYKYGELLLSLSANCRKLQTESEKIIPCGDFEESTITDNPADKDQFKLQALDLQTHLDLTEDEMKAHMDLMKNFWLRQALVEAQNVIMEEKKRQLIEENQKYINKIKALSKTDKASDLQATLHVQCVMEEDPICRALCKLHLK